MGKDPDFDVYLASASPRRRELLKQIGISYRVLDDLNVNEVRDPDESPRQFVARVACEKAMAGIEWIKGRALPACPVLGADTCIEIDGDVLGKPADKSHGIAMLKRLSGRSHKVLTAICVRVPSFDGTREYRDISESQVSFKKLTDREIGQYWESGEPADKAGAYAIQGYAARFITDLNGSYTGVVGLPLFELSRIFEKIGK